MTILLKLGVTLLAALGPLGTAPLSAFPAVTWNSVPLKLKPVLGEQHRIGLSNEEQFWRLHEDAELGYSIRYPSTWVKTIRPPLPDLIGATSFMSRYSQPESAPHRVIVRSPLPGLTHDYPSGESSARPVSLPPEYIIEVGQRPYRRTDDISLRNWTALYLCSTSGISQGEIFQWHQTQSGTTEESVYVIAPNSQFVHVSRGDIVWFVSANFGAQQDLLHSLIFLVVANSVRFDPLAPLSFEDTYRRSPEELKPSEPGKEDCIGTS